MSSVSDIAIPLITGIGGLVLGSGFARVTGRNDVRRQRYADALTAFERLSSQAGTPGDAKQQAAEIGHWLELDSVPVSNAFQDLLRRAAAQPPDTRAIDAARERYVAIAHAYSSWRLPQRFWLQARTKRTPGT